MSERKSESLAEFGLKDGQSLQDIHNVIGAPTTRRVPEGEDIVSAVNSLPAPVTSTKSREDRIHEGGITSYARVFANDVAEPFMKREDVRFPVGAMIVREKLRKPDDQQPQLVAVMIKRDPGFRPQQNDWEFAVIDRGLSRVKRESESCIACHMSAGHSDMVFKSYLPEK